MMKRYCIKQIRTSINNIPRPATEVEIVVTDIEAIRQEELLKARKQYDVNEDDTIEIDFVIVEKS